MLARASGIFSAAAASTARNVATAAVRPMLALRPRRAPISTSATGMSDHGSSSSVRSKYAGDSTPSTASSSYTGASSSGGHRTSAVAQEARIKEIKAELEVARLKKAGLFKERKLTYAGAGAIAAGELVAAGCVIFFTLGWVIYCVDWKEVLDMKDKTVVRVQQEWSSKVAARTEGKEAAAATTVAANSATPAATK